MHRNRSLPVSLALLSCLVVVTGAVAQSPETGYQVPPREIVEIVDAAPTPVPALSPGGEWMALLERPGLPPLSELAEPELRLAGLRFNPTLHTQSRRGVFTGVRLVGTTDGSGKEVRGLPRELELQGVDFSPDDRYLAMTLQEDDGVSLWLAEVATGQSRRLTEPYLNAIFGRPCRWLSNSRELVCRAVASEVRHAEPPRPEAVPTGPVIQESRGRRAPARTYQDLLKSSHDAALFEHYADTELLRVGTDGGVQSLGVRGLLRRAEPSPDGRFLLVEVMERPFSYLVPFYRFPTRVEVRSAAGELVRTVARLPLAEEVPLGRDAVPTGPRSFSWRDDAASTLVWVEAQDGGDPRRPSDVRDRVYALGAPFDGEATVVASLGLRFAAIAWGQEHLALVSERWWRSRQVKVWRFDPAAAESTPVLLFDYSFQDRYNDPGTPVTVANAWGRQVLLTRDQGRGIYLAGRGASAEGDRPFLDALDLETGHKERLWRSTPPYYEELVRVADAQAGVLLTRRESQETPPNYFRRDVGTGEILALTDFPHPTPQIAGVKKELIRYARNDGVQLTGTLYLPVGYEPTDGPLPVLMWAYPREFKSAAVASQVTGSPHHFVRIAPTSPLLWLTQGFAILDNPGMPIVGEGDDQPNDRYVEQLVASAEAAVEEVVRRGVADRHRIAIGGHSYGAFMTANLLAHSDLFRAGIARSGAYNRTLTPFGFQNEERTLWDAPEIYFQMSPFMHAEKVNEPILLIHGEADNNSGTFPLQSRRYFNALKGFGATARLVMLPLESHGYRGRESVLHALWETHRWLEKYVRDARPEETPSSR